MPELRKRNNLFKNNKYNEYDEYDEQNGSITTKIIKYVDQTFSHIENKYSIHSSIFYIIFILLHNIFLIQLDIMPNMIHLLNMTTFMFIFLLEYNIFSEFMIIFVNISLGLHNNDKSNKKYIELSPTLLHKLLKPILIIICSHIGNIIFIIVIILEIHYYITFLTITIFMYIFLLYLFNISCSYIGFKIFKIKRNQKIKLGRI